MSAAEIPQLPITEETYWLLQRALDDARELLGDKIENESDYEDDDIDAMEQKQRDYRELGERLAVLTGKAFEWDAHWTAITEANGTTLQLTHPIGTNPKFLWTVMDDGDGGLAISPGVRVVNKLHYIVSTEPWTEDDEKKWWIY